MRQARVSRHAWRLCVCDAPQERKSGSAGAERFQSTHGCRRYPNVLVGATIIEEPSIAVRHQALHKHHVWNLANLFPIVHRFKDRLLGASDHVGWILLVKKYPPGSIYIVIVRAVVNQENSVVSDNGRGPGLYNLRVKHFWPACQDRVIKYIGPMKQI